MTNKVEFPIRAKLLLLMCAMVLGATGLYLGLALGLFREDKQQLIYELNASNVKTLAAQTEATLSKISDKVKLLTQGHRDEAWTRSVFESEPDLIAYTLYRPTQDPARWDAVTSVRNAEYLKLYGLTTAEVDRIREQAPLPFAKILSARSWAGNSTLQNGAPILTLALAIEIRDPSLSGEFVAVMDLRSDRLLKLLSAKGIATTYLVDSEGRVLVHPDPTLLLARADLSTLPIVRDSIQTPVALQVRKYDWKGETWLGAYSSVGIGGISVISTVNEEQAFRAARSLVEKSVLFGLIVVTASLLISGWLSRSFTAPLEKLVAATEKLSRWEFGESLHVKSKDEIGRLARAFNAMATDLENQHRELAASEAELKLRVKDRTAELETQKKRIAENQDSLLRTTRLASLGELAGSAAHEVLNPLNNMGIRIERMRTQQKETEDNDLKVLDEIVSGWQKAYAEGGWKQLEEELKKNPEGASKILLEEDLDNLTSIARDALKRLSEKGADLEFLEKELARITRIVNSMRTLSRVGGERRPLDIHLPLEETATTLADLFQKRKVELVKDFGAEVREAYTVVADRDELVQVFSNLARNSLQAISEAGRRAGSVRVATRAADGRVEVRITDNGAGISRENLTRIFEPNFTTKSVEDGTGLGLSISRRLVRAFGGDVEIESTREGEGTTFLVWFPHEK